MGKRELERQLVAVGREIYALEQQREELLAALQWRPIPKRPDD